MHAWLGSGDAHQEHHDQNHHEGPHEQQHHPPLTAGTEAPPPPRGDSLARAVIEILQELSDTPRQGGTSGCATFGNYEAMISNKGLEESTKASLTINIQALKD